MARADEPAFPRAGCDWTEDQGDGAWAQSGMTLREYFAGQAPPIPTVILDVQIAQGKDALDKLKIAAETSAYWATLYADEVIAHLAKE